MIIGFGYDYWELRHKVTFDGSSKLIIVNEGETQINVQRDIYSAWKEWVLIRDYAKWDAAMRTVGGDVTPNGFLGASFFTINGWRLLISGKVTIIGNFYSDDFDSPVITQSGVELATLTVSNLIDKIAQDETSNARIFV